MGACGRTSDRASLVSPNSSRRGCCLPCALARQAAPGVCPCGYHVPARWLWPWLQGTGHEMQGSPG